METNNLTAPIAVEKDRNTLTIELMTRMKLHGMAAVRGNNDGRAVEP